jgi:hypothetical protein
MGWEGRGREEDRVVRRGAQKVTGRVWLNLCTVHGPWKGHGGGGGGW